MLQLTGRKPVFPMMTANVKLCRLVGLWYDTNHWRFTWQTVFVICSEVLWFILPTVAFMVRNEKVFAIQMKPILELFAMSMLATRTALHWFHRKTLTECFSDLQKAFDQFSDSAHEDIRSTRRHLQRSADRLVKIYVFVVLFQALSYGPLIVFITIIGYVKGDATLVLTSTVFEADYVFFDHLSSFWPWLSSGIISVIVQFLMLITITASDSLLWNLLHHVSCLFGVIRCEISRLNTFETDHKTFHERLISIVNVHEVAFSCARRLKSVLNPILGFLYCTCIFQTCYVLFIASVVDNPVVMLSMGFVLQYTVFLVFTFSMLGTELIEQSESICNAIYNTRWYEWSVEKRRLLLIMHMRSRRVTGITTANFFYLTRSTFGMAMRTAVSYYTIMRKVYEI